jgi:hypothetical protein
VIDEISHLFEPGQEQVDEPPGKAATLIAALTHQVRHVKVESKIKSGCNNANKNAAESVCSTGLAALGLQKYLVTAG